MDPAFTDYVIYTTYKAIEIPPPPLAMGDFDRFAETRGKRERRRHVTSNTLWGHVTLLYPVRG